MSNHIIEIARSAKIQIGNNGKMLCPVNDWVFENLFYNCNLTLDDMASIFRVGKSVIRRWLKDKGVERFNEKEERLKNNRKVECGCGCGERMWLYHKKWGHERRFLDGHSTRVFKPSISLQARLKNSESKRGDKNPMRRPEVKKKSSESHKGKNWTDAQRESITRTMNTEEYRENASQRTVEMWENSEYRDKQKASSKQKRKRMSQTMKRHFSDPGFEKRYERARLESSEFMKKKWKEPDFVKKQMRSRGVKPNNLEKRFGRICERYGFPFFYTGDGELVVGGKCPDFHDGNKLLIELYGDYWHRNQNPQERIDHMAEYGYVCLVIWECEFKDMSSLIKKVRKFIKRNASCQSQS